MREDRVDSIGVLADGPATNDDAFIDEGPGLYRQFIGDWDFETEYYREDGRIERAAGEWRFAWALEGRAIVDLWTYPSRAEREKTGEGPGGLGLTVRTYDPESGIWNIAWNAANGRFLHLKGRKIGTEIVQEGVEDGQPTRWILFDMAADSFSWRAEVSDDGGGTWKRNQLMRVRRAGGGHA